MELLGSAKLLAHPYHSMNILFSLSYVCAKLIPVLCSVLFPAGTEPELNMWESEVLFFLMVVVMFRSRRSGARTLVAYTSLATFYAKACNCILWGSADPIKGVVYFFVLLVHNLLVGEPVPPRGPEQVTYFEGLNDFDAALKSSPDMVWVVAFFTTWAPPCAQLAPVFSELSNSYSLPTLKWGKVDVGRHQDVAQAHHINITPLSLQLPTIAIYRGGKLLMRRPTTDEKNKFQRFYFTSDNIVAAYDLNNLYLDCQRRQKEAKAKRTKAD